jgi:hypothetical protein
MLRSRNHSLGFAERTRKNLAYIEGAFAKEADVHVVTQILPRRCISRSKTSDRRRPNPFGERVSR